MASRSGGSKDKKRREQAQELRRQMKERDKKRATANTAAARQGVEPRRYTREGKKKPPGESHDAREPVAGLVSSSNL